MFVSWWQRCSQSHTSRPDAINRLQNWFSVLLFLLWPPAWQLQWVTVIVCLVSFKGTYGWHLLQKAQQSLISFRQNDPYFPSLCNKSVFFGVLVCFFSSSVADSLAPTAVGTRRLCPLSPIQHSFLSFLILIFLLLLFLSLFTVHREQKSVSTLSPRHHSTCWAPHSHLFVPLAS